MPNKVNKRKEINKVMDLKECRDKIDQIDDQICALFKQRMEVVVQVAQYKKENGLPVLNSSREREILARACGQCGEELELYTKLLFNTIFDLSRARQTALLATETPLAKRIEAARAETPALFPKKAVVACQGVEGAYSQQACDKLFALPSILYFNTFEAVFQAVDRGMCEYGILPIENSSYGSVNEVYDLMKKYSFHIARCTRLRIRHDLLVNPGAKLEDIKEIVSHEQALGQCSEFLNGLKGVTITRCENTAKAAKMVAESGRKDIAAISSHNCAELYGLEPLKSGVQNSENNDTRFICISKKMQIFPGANRISVMTGLAHQPGSLNAMLAKFAALGLNLSKLESRPIEGTDFEFMFYFDVSASIDDPEVVRVLGDLERESAHFTFLGAYTEA